MNEWEDINLIQWYLKYKSSLGMWAGLWLVSTLTTSFRVRDLMSIVAWCEWGHFFSVAYCDIRVISMWLLRFPIDSFVWSCTKFEEALWFIIAIICLVVVRNILSMNSCKQVLFSLDQKTQAAGDKAGERKQIPTWLDCWILGAVFLSALWLID